MTLKHSFLPLPLVVAGGLLACSAYPVESGATPVSFSEHIRPILNRNCVGCHGGVKKAGKISFIYREDALGEGKSGETVIDTSNRCLDQVEIAELIAGSRRSASVLLSGVKP